MDTSRDVFPRVVDLAPIVESISGTVLKDLPNPDASLPMKSNLARSERNGSNERADTRASGSWAANVYAIVGPDGAGKTTIARDIMDRLARRGVKTWIAWMRSPRIVTLGVLGITRLSKLSRTVRMGDHDDVITDLSRHPFLLHLYSWAVTFDYFLGYLGKVTLPKRLLRRTVFCDRFAWDTLVDLGLISGVDEGFLQFPQGQILLDLARKHRSGLVTASREELIRRKPILSLDPRLARRLRLYTWRADRFGFGQVDSRTTSQSESASHVSQYLGTGPARLPTSPSPGLRA